MFEIVVGTNNAGKASEIAALLAGLKINVKSLSDFECVEEVAETGETFRENAALKAAGYAMATCSWVLADDSGLEVDILGKKPGVFSARYAGKSASDAQNMDKLLEELKEFSMEERSACFVCEMALAAPDGSIRFTSSGRCPGYIARKPIGLNGFGYDPIFVPDGFSQTFGELPESVKESVSHRSAATRKLLDFLRISGAALLDP